MNPPNKTTPIELLSPKTVPADQVASWKESSHPFFGSLSTPLPLPMRSSLYANHSPTSNSKIEQKSTAKNQGSSSESEWELMEPPTSTLSPSTPQADPFIPPLSRENDPNRVFVISHPKAKKEQTTVDIIDKKKRTPGSWAVQSSILSNELYVTPADIKGEQSMLASFKTKATSKESSLPSPHFSAFPPTSSSYKNPLQHPGTAASAQFSIPHSSPSPGSSVNSFPSVMMDPESARAAIAQHALARPSPDTHDISKHHLVSNAPVNGGGPAMEPELALASGGVLDYFGYSTLPSTIPSSSSSVAIDASSFSLHPVAPITTTFSVSAAAPPLESSTSSMNFNADHPQALSSLPSNKVYDEGAVPMHNHQQQHLLLLQQELLKLQIEQEHLDRVGETNQPPPALTHAPAQAIAHQQSNLQLPLPYQEIFTPNQPQYLYSQTQLPRAMPFPQHIVSPSQASFESPSHQHLVSLAQSPPHPLISLMQQEAAAPSPPQHQQQQQIHEQIQEQQLRNLFQSYLQHHQQQELMTHQQPHQFSFKTTSPSITVSASALAPAPTSYAAASNGMHVVNGYGATESLGWLSQASQSVGVGFDLDYTALNDTGGESPKTASGSDTIGCSTTVKSTKKLAGLSSRLDGSLREPDRKCIICKKVCGEAVAEEVVHIPATTAGFVFGRHFENIRRIQEETNTIIDTNTKADSSIQAIVKGHTESVWRAVELLSKLVERYVLTDSFIGRASLSP